MSNGETWVDEQYEKWLQGEESEDRVVEQEVVALLDIAIPGLGSRWDSFENEYGAEPASRNAITVIAEQVLDGTLRQLLMRSSNNYDPNRHYLQSELDDLYNSGDGYTTAEANGER